MTLKKPNKEEMLRIYAFLSKAIGASSEGKKTYRKTSLKQKLVRRVIAMCQKYCTHHYESFDKLFLVGLSSPAHYRCHTYSKCIYCGAEDYTLNVHKDLRVFNESPRAI